MKVSEFNKNKTAPLASPQNPTITTPTKKTVFVQKKLPQQNPAPTPPEPKQRRWLKGLVITALLLVLAGGGLFAVKAQQLKNKIFVTNNQQGFLPDFLNLKDLVNSDKTKLIGETEGQINILLLGIGGPEHDGPYLTDTMILLQYRPGEKRASMTSIPRDYWSTKLGSKINGVFAYEFDKKQNWNDAGKAIRSEIETMSGLTIPYFVVGDFDGFVKVIDTLGGVEVTVDRTFTDYTFPNDATKGYLKPQTFKAGTEVMDGKRALIFARSRHAAGDEGTDFARSLRQQKVISASKAKAEQLNLVTDLNKISQLMGTVATNIKTNIAPNELLHLYKLGKELNQNSVTSLSLDPESGLVCEGKSTSGMYILTLCSGKTKVELQNYFKNSFTTTPIFTEKATVTVIDTTPKGIAYSRVAKELAAYNVTVVRGKWSVDTEKPLGKNQLYIKTEKPYTQKFITDTYQATPMTEQPTGAIVSNLNSDMVFILSDETAIPTQQTIPTNAPASSRSTTPTR